MVHNCVGKTLDKKSKRAPLVAWLKTIIFRANHTTNNKGGHSIASNANTNVNDGGNNNGGSQNKFYVYLLCAMESLRRRYVQ
jgi:hypothetical protein